MGSSAFSFFPLFLFSLSLLQPARAQPAETDSAATHAAYAGALEVYHRYLTPETRLYRGSQYVDYAYQIDKGHPFFNSDHMQNGSVYYDGVAYRNIDIIYDLVTEQVVINDPFKVYKIFLISEQLARFTVGDHFFVRITDTLNTSAPRAGFYEQLYQGRITLYKKEKKSIQEDLTTGEIKRYILYNTSYYLKKGDTYYPVNNKGSLLHALGDRSREVKKFIRKSGLNMRKDEENTLLKVSAWYDNQTINSVDQ